MALIFIGHSKCALCQQELLETDEIVGLPPSPYINHPLHRYFDEGFHKKCYDNWGIKTEVEELIKKAMDQFYNSDYAKEMEKRYGKPNTFMPD